MASRNTTFSVRVTNGGRLVSTRSPENVGVANYSVKTNWRRFDDREILREGTKLFRPNLGQPQGSQHLNVSPTDILGMWECVRPNGDRTIVAATTTSVYRYNYSTAAWVLMSSSFSSSATEWQGEQLDGTLILNNQVDLPVTFRVEAGTLTPIYEMRELGIAAVGQIAVVNGFLVCADITEIQSTQLATWMNGLTPYGVVPSNLVNRIRYKIAWSDFGDGRNWSPVITGTIQSATRNKVTLEFPLPTTFAVGTKLAIIGAGANGSTLGGEDGADGVAVTSVTGAELTLASSADATLTYPLTVSVTRFADTSTFVGSATIKDDSSPIVAIRPLKQVLVVYRQASGIWIGRYTGSVETPFQFKPAYRGADVPAYSRAIIDIEGDYHLYPSTTNFHMFDGAGNPRLHSPTDDASTQFFAGLSEANAYRAFASHNPVTREVWFHSANGVLAFDYVTGTTSWIDDPYTAAAYVKNPGGTDYWFILAKAGMVLQYGMTASGVITYQRIASNGTSGAVTHVLQHGELSLNDDENEKDLMSYMPLFAKVNTPVRIKIYSRDNIAADQYEELNVLLESPKASPLLETYFRAVYFADRVEYTSTNDVPAEFTGCTFTLSPVASHGVTRNANGNS